MSLSRRFSVSAAIAAQCLVSTFGANLPAKAQTSPIPGYFFSQWTVTSNCTEQSAGLAAVVPLGLQFTISGNYVAADGNYVLQAINGSQLQWPAGWNGLELQYRAGSQMTTLPADFECIADQPSTSPLLAMSSYAQTAEPYYAQEHWYGLATIAGQQEHVLIFPRPITGDSSAIILLESVNPPSTVQLDDNGVLHSQN